MRRHNKKNLNYFDIVYLGTAAMPVLVMIPSLGFLQGNKPLLLARGLRFSMGKRRWRQGLG